MLPEGNFAFLEKFPFYMVIHKKLNEKSVKMIVYKTAAV